MSAFGINDVDPLRRLMIIAEEGLKHPSPRTGKSKLRDPEIIPMTLDEAFLFLDEMLPKEVQGHIATMTDLEAVVSILDEILAPIILTRFGLWWNSTLVQGLRREHSLRNAEMPLFILRKYAESKRQPSYWDRLGDPEI